MADLVHSLVTRLEAHGLKDVVIDNIVRDEVQDFSMAELFLDTRSVQVMQLCCTHAYIALSDTVNTKTHVQVGGRAVRSPLLWRPMSDNCTWNCLQVQGCVRNAA